MRARWVVLVAGMAVAVAACTPGTQGGPAAPRPDARDGATPAVSPVAEPRELLVLGSPLGAAVLDARTGSELFAGVGVPALGDWSMLATATATTTGDATVVRVTRDVSGESVGTARVAGQLAVRTVSPDGSRVALMAPLPPGANPWIPEDRASTTIVVTNPSGYFHTKRFHLKGNFEPEAFSADNTGLFLIKYVPAIDPVAYRVTRLDLDEGEVYPVFGRLKSPVETMSGTRLMQLPAPNGARLYTLYTSQPAEYAREYDPMQAKAGTPVAFVHTLSLDDGWAECVGLPRALGDGNPVHEALALSPDGRSLYVVDTQRGVVAVMDTRRMKVVRDAKADFSALGGGQVHAAVGSDGRTLVVAAGNRVEVLRTRTMRPEHEWTASGPVTALGFGSEGRNLYVAMPGAVEELDLSTGRSVRILRTPGSQAYLYVGSLTS
ncbi:MAG: hypothetical protein M3Q23_07335 [Actinomycetota bacterium]|nr:hypothetical protein [Actinomycetota bacterium]